MFMTSAPHGCSEVEIHLALEYPSPLPSSVWTKGGGIEGSVGEWEKGGWEGGQGVEEGGCLSDHCLLLNKK